MSITGPVEGPPSKVGVAVTDVLTGIYAATAILACLIARGQSGHGYAIDLSLLESAIASQVNFVQAFLARRQSGASPSEAVPARQGNAHLQIVPYQLFRTADSWLVLAVGNDGQWKQFAGHALPNLMNDPRFVTNPGRVKHRHELVPLVEAALRRKTTDEWVSVLEQLGVPHAPLWTYAELFSHPHMHMRGMCVQVRDSAGRPIDLVGSPFHISATGAPTAPPESTAPPELGQHTNEVLRELCGMNEETLQRLQAEGVIGPGPHS
jgi:crotonobetainyl-CoA:carnitine CoA-transferase CaiB-like acyl-CoA transferase